MVFFVPFRICKQRSRPFHAVFRTNCLDAVCRWGNNDGSINNSLSSVKSLPRLFMPVDVSSMETASHEHLLGLKIATIDGTKALKQNQPDQNYQARDILAR